MMLAPPLVTAALVVAAGLLANAPFSPLEWVRLITEKEYGP
jgi:multicomponent Na+:H+ antiporter subunit D